MKKIFSIFASSVLALSMFVSCSGDLHNDMDPAKVALIMGETKTILDEADLMGDFLTDTDWEAQYLTKVDSTTYTFSFTARKDKHNFAIRKVAGQWDIARWFGENKDDKDNPFSIAPGESHIMTYYEGGTIGGDFGLSGLTVGKSYTLTIKIENEDKNEISASLAEGGDAPVADTPAPFYLDGEFVTGCDDLLVGKEKCQFDFPSSQLLFNPELDKKTSELTYTFDVTFTSKNHNWHEPGEAAIKISQPGWKNSYGKTTIKVGEDFVELESSGDNAPVSGLKDGKAYRIEIKTTPEKKVYAKVYEILAYKLQLKITGFDGVDGQTAIVHGTFDGWAKWTSAWGGDAKVSETATKAVIADNTAVINITSGVAAPNEEISFEGCGYYGTVEGDDIKKANGEIKIGGKDFKITGKITKAGTYVATLDLSEGEISEAVSE